MKSGIRLFIDVPLAFAADIPNISSIFFETVVMMPIFFPSMRVSIAHEPL